MNRNGNVKRSKSNYVTSVPLFKAGDTLRLKRPRAGWLPMKVIDVYAVTCEKAVPNPNWSPSNGRGRGNPHRTVAEFYDLWYVTLDAGSSVYYFNEKHLEKVEDTYPS